MTEHLDLLRSIYAEWEHGDFSSARWAHPAIEFVIVGGPDPGAWTGIDGMAEGWFRFLQAWDDFHVEPEEYRALDRARTLVLIRRSGRGRTSGLEVDEMHSEAADLFDVADGKVIRLVHYWERARALADLGIEEQAVARENVEVVRQMWQVFADAGLDAMTGFLDAEINWRAIEGAPDDVVEMRGIEAARRYVQDWLDTFEGITSVTEELLDAGDDRVIAALHVTGRAKLSGVETELRYAVLYTLREGKIVRVREYATREDALKAAGLADR
jgi:ketosteroid isomerase-like protein